MKEGREFETGRKGSKQRERKNLKDEGERKEPMKNVEIIRSGKGREGRKDEGHSERNKERGKKG